MRSALDRGPRLEPMGLSFAPVFVPPGLFSARGNAYIRRVLRKNPFIPPDAADAGEGRPSRP